MYTITWNKIKYQTIKRKGERTKTLSIDNTLNIAIFLQGKHPISCEYVLFNINFEVMLKILYFVL